MECRNYLDYVAIIRIQKESGRTEVMETRNQSVTAFIINLECLCVRSSFLQMSPPVKVRSVKITFCAKLVLLRGHVRENATDIEHCDDYNHQQQHHYYWFYCVVFFSIGRLLIVVILFRQYQQQVLVFHYKYRQSIVVIVISVDVTIDVAV